LFPRVESPELLVKAISWTRFPPEGVRGYGLTAPHLEDENIAMPDVIAHLNQNTLVVFQIETKTAMDRIEELLSVPNIDAVMIGPADLSISLGVPGQFDHPKLVEAIERLVAHDLTQRRDHKLEAVPGYPPLAGLIRAVDGGRAGRSDDLARLARAAVGGAIAGPLALALARASAALVDDDAAPALGPAAARPDRSIRLAVCHQLSSVETSGFPGRRGGFA